MSITVYACGARPCAAYPNTDIIPGDEKWIRTPAGEREARHAQCAYRPGSWSTTVDFVDLGEPELAELKSDVWLRHGDTYHQLGEINVEREPDSRAVLTVSAYSKTAEIWLFLVVDGKINDSASLSQHPPK